MTAFNMRELNLPIDFSVQQAHTKHMTTSQTDQQIRDFAAVEYKRQIDHNLSAIIEIEEVAYHRNGICGEGFHLVKFTDSVEGPMLGVLFAPDYDEDGYNPKSNGRCAIMQRDKLKDDVIAFMANSWRGDHWEDVLRQAIKDHDDAKYAWVK